MWQKETQDHVCLYLQKENLQDGMITMEGRRARLFTEYFIWLDFWVMGLLRKITIVNLKTNKISLTWVIRLAFRGFYDHTEYFVKDGQKVLKWVSIFGVLINSQINWGTWQYRHSLRETHKRSSETMFLKCVRGWEKVGYALRKLQGAAWFWKHHLGLKTGEAEAKHWEGRVSQGVNFSHHPQLG